MLRLEDIIQPFHGLVDRVVATHVDDSRTFTYGHGCRRLPTLGELTPKRNEIGTTFFTSPTGVWREGPSPPGDEVDGEVPTTLGFERGQASGRIVDTSLFRPRFLRINDLLRAEVTFAFVSALLHAKIINFSS